MSAKGEFWLDEDGQFVTEEPSGDPDDILHAVTYDTYQSLITAMKTARPWIENGVAFELIDDALDWVGAT